MVIHELGKQHHQTLLFFPGSCEPCAVFALAVVCLAEQFHVIAITSDGHDPAEGTDFPYFIRLSTCIRCEFMVQSSL